MFANFSWFWKRKLQTLLSLLVQKDVDQKRSTFSQYWGLHFVPLPPFNHHFIIHPELFILCLINVKRVTSSDFSSCIYHPFTHRIINLLCVSHVQCDMSYLFQEQQMTVGDPSRLFNLCFPILSLLMCDICHSFYNPLEVRDLI